MIDIGLSKIALIAVVALVVVGPERLPRVARTAGNLFGRAQRYMNDVRNEVSRQMEQEDLKKMKEAATEAFRGVQEGMNQIDQTITNEISEVMTEFDPSTVIYKSSTRQGRQSWRNKKGAIPNWFKHSAGIKTRAQSGAARVKRFRRSASQQRTPKSFFG
jgi:sec-independent protein translocase protein TatB